MAPADSKLLTREVLLAFWKVHLLHHAEEGRIFGQWILTELRRHGYDISPGTLYPLLNRMERNGWLRREPAAGAPATGGTTDSLLPVPGSCVCCATPWWSSITRWSRISPPAPLDGGRPTRGPDQRPEFGRNSCCSKCLSSRQGGFHRAPDADAASRRRPLDRLVLRPSITAPVLNGRRQPGR